MDHKNPFPGTVSPSLFEDQLTSNNPTIIPPHDEKVKPDFKSKPAPKPETTKDNMQYK